MDLSRPQEVVLRVYLEVVLDLMVVVLGAEELQQVLLIQVLIHIQHLLQVVGDIRVDHNHHILDQVEVVVQVLLEVVLQELLEVEYKHQLHLRIQKQHMEIPRLEHHYLVDFTLLEVGLVDYHMFHLEVVDLVVVAELELVQDLMAQLILEVEVVVLAINLQELMVDLVVPELSSLHILHKYLKSI